MADARLEYQVLGTVKPFSSHEVNSIGCLLEVWMNERGWGCCYRIITTSIR